MILEARPSMTCIELTPEEIAVFRQLARPLRDNYLEMGGDGARDVLKAVLADIQWAQKSRAEDSKQQVQDTEPEHDS